MKHVPLRKMRFPRLPGGIVALRPPVSSKAAPGLGAQPLGAAPSSSLRSFSKGLAHNLNNSLAVIGGNAEMIQRLLPPDSPAQEMLQRILAATRATEDMARQLLLYSQSFAHSRQRLNVSSLVMELQDTIRPRVAPEVSLRFEVDPNVPDVLGDQAQLRRLVTNLLINASEAVSDNSGTIAIRTQAVEVGSEFPGVADAHLEFPSGRCIYMQVADTGIGMDEETRKHIFEPFYSTKFVGRGLGLSVGLGIVKQHHGAMWVSSMPGQGTTVHVLLPCVEA
jgi:two-component system, cell cycle sensor histidine kinase and response regulator CckA